MMLVGLNSGELDRGEAIRRSFEKSGSATREVENCCGKESARRVSSWTPKVAEIFRLEGEPQSVVAGGLGVGPECLSVYPTAVPDVHRSRFPHSHDERAPHCHFRLLLRDQRGRLEQNRVLPQAVNLPAGRYPLKENAQHMSPLQDLFYESIGRGVAAGE